MGVAPFTLVTPTASADGYGCAGEALALAAVREHGADIQVIGHDWADERFSDPAFLAMKVPEAMIAQRDTVVVFFLPYALGHFRSRRTLCMTMWETDRLPDVWAALIEAQADGVIVPSEHCRRVFQARTSRQVEVAPLGTDVAFYAPAERAPGRSPYTFLMSGLLHYRKGVEFALRAFREEFPREPVRLVLKTRRGFLDWGEEGRALGDERVRVIDEDYSREQMRDLYAGADCLLAPSRGEGAGLTPRDAMATGLPVILTNWGGLEELCDERYTFPVPVEDLEAAPWENTSYGPGVTGGGQIGRFARPSVAGLRAAMRSAYEAPEAAAQRGSRAAAWVRQAWSWERCAGLWLDVVGRQSEAA